MFVNVFLICFVFIGPHNDRVVLGLLLCIALVLLALYFFNVRQSDDDDELRAANDSLFHRTMHSSVEPNNPMYGGSEAESGFASARADET